LVPFAASVGLFILSAIGLGISLYPYVVPPSLSIFDAAAAPSSLIFALFGVLFVLPLVLGYTVFVYWTFQGKVRPGEGYH
jgi:cytochrome d ubiquinol oxidase subunit II